MTLDLHNYDRKFANTLRQIEHSTLSTRNKTLLLAYKDACLLRNVCGKVRLIRALGALHTFAQHVPKDFDRWTRKDVETLLRALLARQPPYSVNTLSTYKSMLRSFLSYVSAPSKFPNSKTPASVAWLVVNVRKRDRPRLDRNDLLTPTDIEALVNISQNPRDKALITMLWETGCRIAELGNLQLKHLTKTEHGFELAVTGKTGKRTPLVVSSTPYLVVWLNSHPFRNDPEAPLWVHYHHATSPKPLQYATIRILLKRAFEKAQLAKPFHPHIFRHSRATYILANAIMNEAQAKAYFGWTPDSHMLATYAHLLTADTHAALLQEHGLARESPRRPTRPTRECGSCGEFNTADANYCIKCGHVLGSTDHEGHAKALLNELFRRAKERGILDDAYR